ncbi:transcription factor iws1 [Cylindrobasidium torrendii FP15055 ss-10]|uniref:Transcription factor iws1 n=1 Tax=Cylindrobasidium torrendii FP15055 ss-10 TaxID=1314674 RepID=A0A0D7BFX3_9AGAR|nr:transcription factor iws1 [Cylindrobasidium torrendii FP15055 ss-10]
MADVNGLERDIFGSDSELSDDDRPKATDERNFESSGGDSDEDYRNEQRPAKGKTLKKKAERVRQSTAGTKRKRTSTAAPKKPQYDDAELEAMAPEKAAQIRMGQRIDEILKPKRSKPKKRKNEEALDSYADDQVARLRENMNAAADEDIRSNQEQLPAIQKLRLLPEVVVVLQKASLAQSIIDNNLLEGVRRWLEPLPDKSLPSLNIQREFFGILPKLEFIDSAVLKESGLGRIVMFYTKCARVTDDIKRTANSLVMIWARPIIKRSSSYRDRSLPTVQVDKTAGVTLSQIMARAKQDDKNRTRKNAASIPYADVRTYTVAPVPSLRRDATIDNDSARRRNNNARLKTLKSRISQK